MAKHDKIATFQIAVSVGDHSREELEAFVLDSLRKDGWDTQCVSLIDVNPKGEATPNEHNGPYPISYFTTHHADGTLREAVTVFATGDPGERSAITGALITHLDDPFKTQSHED